MDSRLRDRELVGRDVVKVSEQGVTITELEATRHAATLVVWDLVPISHLLEVGDPLTDLEVDSLVCFLRTLTDQRYEHLIEDKGIDCAD